MGHNRDKLVITKDNWAMIMTQKFMQFYCCGQGFSLGFWSLPQMEFYSNNFFQLGKLVHQLIPTVEIDFKMNSQYREIDSQSNFHLWALITSLISISGN